MTLCLLVQILCLQVLLRSYKLFHLNNSNSAKFRNAGKLSLEREHLRFERERKKCLLLSRNFYVCTLVSFTRVNKIEVIYGRSRTLVKVEPRSTLLLRAEIYMRKHVKITRRWKSTLRVDFHCRVIFPA